MNSSAMPLAPFHFCGEIPGSKSLLNRALLLQSHCPQIEIGGASHCEDVVNMKKALVSFIQKKEIHCGEAGTVFRFMAMRVSRERGTFILRGSERLLARSHDDLYFLFEQLGVRATKGKDFLLIESQGWKKPLVPLQVRRESSSQFASALLLNSWNLSFDLEFEMKSGVSQGYWTMSMEMAEQVGLLIRSERDRFVIIKGQTPQPAKIQIEPDYSSAFVIAAAGVLAGESVITNGTAKSLQPDFRFIEILRLMGARVEAKVVGSFVEYTFQKPKELKPIEVDLETSPDLFPVLSVLCAFAKGKSLLTGAPHLVHKESNRIEKSSELLRAAGILCQPKNDGIQIVGEGFQLKPGEIKYNPDQDHRMAMAAGLFKLKGFKGRVEHPEVVNKSFPDFWKVTGIQP